MASRLRPGIVLLDAETLGEIPGFQAFTKLGNLTVFESTRPDQRIDRLRGKEIAITNKVAIDREVMNACPSLKLICVAATGLNNIDLPCAAEKGIAVRNVAGYSTPSVVQHTFGMLFYLMESFPYYDRFVKEGRYAGSHLFTHHGRPFSELSGMQFGIIGMGTIGKKVAEAATAFGARVWYYSTSGRNTEAGYPCVPLPELLAGSDILSVHCPLNEQTHYLLRYPELASMKKTAYLINAGRGGIIHEGDLAKGLGEGLLAGAALDVLESEPPDPDNPLFFVREPDRLLITPHIAWASRESRGRLIEGIARNIAEYLEKE